MPEKNTEISDPSSDLGIRHASVADGAKMWKLVRQCGVLDVNSCYAYLLFCRDFSATTLVADADEGLLGFVTAYIPPPRPEAVFVWQIGTAPAARRKGVGKALLRALLRCDACKDVRFLEATVTPSNTASARLFQSIADEFGADFNVGPGFAASDFDPADGDAPDEEVASHEPEDLVRIGPIEE